MVSKSYIRALERGALSPIILAFAVFLLLPVLYYHAPQYYGKPDIQYVKAKVLSVSQGDLFGDPVTGLPNFHPPYYHLFLSCFTRLGVDIDTLLFLVSVTNVCLLFLLTFYVLAAVFQRRTAFICTLMIPFIVQRMGQGNIMLATAFYFSLPFYLAGLLLYLKPVTVRSRLMAIPVLWGCAFLISPVYIFLIAFTFADGLFFRRSYGRSCMFALIFLMTITPFYFQFHAVYHAGMANTSTFALWRGVPDWQWLKSLALSFISPAESPIRALPVGLALIFAGLGIIGICRKRPLPFFPIIAFAAYIFTAYHFNLQYAIRIQFFLSLFLTAYAIDFLISIRLKKVIFYAAISAWIIFGIIDHFSLTKDLIKNREENIALYKTYGAELWSHLGEYLQPDRYIVVTDDTYRYFIMPYFPAHALLAYKSGEYFQLSEATAQAMQKDYTHLMTSGDIDAVEYYCQKYDMASAVIHVKYEMQIPAFQVIARNWKLVYQDSYFRIYQRPAP